MRERRDGGGGKGEGGGDNKPHPTDTRKPAKYRGGGASHLATKSSDSAGGMPVHYVVLPALLLGGVAIAVFFGEAWWMGSGVNKPLPLPSVVSGDWRNEEVYNARLWGTYR